MGLTLTFEDFRRCLRNPWTVRTLIPTKLVFVHQKNLSEWYFVFEFLQVGVGFLAQYLIKPMLGFFIAMVSGQHNHEHTDYPLLICWGTNILVLRLWSFRTCIWIRWLVMLPFIKANFLILPNLPWFRFLVRNPDLWKFEMSHCYVAVLITSHKKII